MAAKFKCKLSMKGKMGVVFIGKHFAMMYATDMWTQEDITNYSSMVAMEVIDEIETQGIMDKPFGESEEDGTKWTFGDVHDDLCCNLEE